MSENNNTQKPIETLKKLEQNLESAVSVLKEKHSYFEVVLTFDENGKRQVFFDDIDGIIIKGVDEQICDETLKQFNIVKIVDELLKVIKIDHDDSIVLTPKDVYLNFSHINAEKELTQSRVDSIQKLFEALSQFQQMLKNDCDVFKIVFEFDIDGNGDVYFDDNKGIDFDSVNEQSAIAALNELNIVRLIDVVVKHTKVDCNDKIIVKHNQLSLHFRKLNNELSMLKREC